MKLSCSGYAVDRLIIIFLVISLLVRIKVIARSFYTMQRISVKPYFGIGTKSSSIDSKSDAMTSKPRKLPHIVI
ncbi:hypothetical protein A3759_01855 [Thalassolituus sp. HI0120]|nr:hypothetical protein A3759_01855 [Thalassolituus sp. HI0120]